MFPSFSDSGRKTETGGSSLTDGLNFYETLYLVRPDIDSGELSAIREKLAAALSRNSGETIRDERWDERDLAYEIGGYRRGTYHILTYRALPGVVAEVEKHLRFYKSEVMRFITVSVDEGQAHGREPEKPPADAGTEKDSGGGFRKEGAGEMAAKTRSRGSGAPRYPEQRKPFEAPRERPETEEEK